MENVSNKLNQRDDYLFFFHEYLSTKAMLESTSLVDEQPKFKVSESYVHSN